jgi:glutaredoxin 3
MNTSPQPVIIYTTPVCTYCKHAKDFFKENNVSYTEIDVAADTEKRAEMIDKSGQMGVPVIEIGDNIVIGFDQETIEELLGIKKE